MLNTAAEHPCIRQAALYDHAKVIPRGGGATVGQYCVPMSQSNAAGAAKAS